MAVANAMLTKTLPRPACLSLSRRGRTAGRRSQGGNLILFTSVKSYNKLKGGQRLRLRFVRAPPATAGIAATTPLTEGRAPLAPLAPPPLNSYKAKKAKIITTKYIAISV